MGAHWDAAGCGRDSLDHAAVPQGRPRWTLDPWAQRLRGCLQVTPGWLGLGSLGKGPGRAIQHHGQIGGSAPRTEPGGGLVQHHGQRPDPTHRSRPVQHHGQLRAPFSTIDSSGAFSTADSSRPPVPQISPSRSRSLHHPPRTSPAALPASPEALLLPCWNPRLMQNCYW